MNEAESEVLVGRCVVTVIRRGGWSWGPAPERLVQRVVEALPALLEARFAAELAGEEDVEIDEPVTIDVPVSLADLRAGLVEAAIVAAAARLPGGALAAPFAASTPGVSSGAGSMAPKSSPPQAAAVNGSDPGQADGTALPDQFDVDSTSSTGGPRPALDRAAGLDALIRLLAEPAERGELERLLRSLPEESRRVYGTVLDPAAPAPPSSLPGAPLVIGMRRRTGEVEVESVLPFLVTVALHRTGLLEQIAPALAGAGLGEEVPLFAAALAYKVLGPLARGWQRSTSDRTAAAAFAGLADDVPDDALVDLARRAGPALPLLDGLVGLAIGRGHEPAQPLLLAGVGEAYGGGLLLVESEGLFPVAWADAVPALLPYWEGCGRPLVLAATPDFSATTPGGPAPGAQIGPGSGAPIGPGSGAPIGPGSGLPLGAGSSGPLGAALVALGGRHLRDLAEAGVPVVTEAPPTRGEHWRRLPGGHRRWAAGPADRWADARLAARAATADIAGAAAGLDELVTAMARRRAAPLADGWALERTLTLLAATGLGTIAWLLWRHREPPDPQLALARLGDLGGLVRFDAAEVRIRLPYGPRQADLERHGLLADVPDVAWLDGRALTFGKG